MADKRQKDHQIEHLPAGWSWSNKPWTYQTKTGKEKTSTARHGVGPGGQTISLREVQNRQHAAEAKANVVKPPAQRRTGKVRTFKDFHPESPQSRFKPEIHGETRLVSFYTIEEMRQYIIAHPIDEKYKNVCIQINYQEKLNDANKTGSPTAKGTKDGWATISSFRTAKTYNTTASILDADIQVGENIEIENPWRQAVRNSYNYELYQNKARVYLYLAER